MKKKLAFIDYAPHPGPLPKGEREKSRPGILFKGKAEIDDWNLVFPLPREEREKPAWKPLQRKSGNRRLEPRIPSPQRGEGKAGPESSSKEKRK
jgi:hypothetical protein